MVEMFNNNLALAAAGTAYEGARKQQRASKPTEDKQRALLTTLFKKAASKNTQKANEAGRLA